MSKWMFVPEVMRFPPWVLHIFHSQNMRLGSNSYEFNLTSNHENVSTKCEWIPSKSSIERYCVHKVKNILTFSFWPLIIKILTTFSLRPRESLSQILRNSPIIHRSGINGWMENPKICRLWLLLWQKQKNVNSMFAPVIFSVCCLCGFLLHIKIIMNLESLSYPVDLCRYNLPPHLFLLPHYLNVKSSVPAAN